MVSYAMVSSTTQTSRAIRTHICLILHILDFVLHPRTKQIVSLKINIIIGNNTFLYGIPMEIKCNSSMICSSRKTGRKRQMLLQTCKESFENGNGKEKFSD